MDLMKQFHQAKYARDEQSGKKYSKGCQNNFASGSIGGLSDWERKKSYRLNRSPPNRPNEGGRYQRSLKLAPNTSDSNGRFYCTQFFIG